MANLLQYETSPYLLQHAHNPVNWMPWSDAAFEKAQAENKPVLVSIGYATCHWCHVMERESFEDEQIAAYMNEHFVCVKVDREEHPDVDHMYMDALIAMQQGGGWPLNMFVTPDRKPFYGGTYFPPQRYHNRASWSEVLEALAYTWKEKNDEIMLQANQLIQHLNQVNQQTATKVIPMVQEDADKVKDRLLALMDVENGGFSNAPKFLSTYCIQYLLDYAFFNENKSVFDLAKRNLDKMLAGGIYDQLEGGISRYSTDNEWLVPHFEKMLYDNALLLQVLASASKIQRNEYYLAKIKQTIHWANEWLLDDATGLMKSAVDADSEGVEGKFYVWTYGELVQHIPEAYFAYFKYYWGFTLVGNWEEVNILHEQNSDEAVCTHFDLTAAEWQKIKQAVIATLLEVRNLRIKPIVDTKLIVSQNAMWATALVEVYKATGDKAYFDQAESILSALLSSCNNDPNLLPHIVGKANIQANLEDFAWMIKALLKCYEVNAKELYLTVATEMMQYVLFNFDTDQHTLLYFSHQDQQDILVKKIETYDGAVPSSNGLMMHNLLILGNLTYNFDWLERARCMLYQLHSQLVHYPSSYAYFAMVFQYFLQENGVLKTNKNADLLLVNYYAPHIFFTFESENQHKINENWYQFCKDGQCEMPVNIELSLFEIKKIKSDLF